MDYIKIIEGIASIRDSMVRSKAINNPYILSERMVELAQLNHMLTDLVADAKLEAKKCLASQYKLFRDAGASSSGAMSEAKLSKDVLEAEYKSDRISQMVSQTANLISACQSHIKVKMQEISQQSLNT